MKTVLFIFGTRPEAIKLAPIIHVCQSEKGITVKTCITSQHREMLDQVVDFFQLNVDFDLNLMKKDQTLFDITAIAMSKLQDVIKSVTPDLVVVQGDTTTAFLGALAGYYSQIKVAHVEAGLRSHQKYSPFPEEINRKLISHIADMHFVPTEYAKQNLENEGISNNTWIVGNSVIDALNFAVSKISENSTPFLSPFNTIDLTKKIVLVTGHRREHFGEKFQQICEALKEIALNNPDIEIVYPVHLNPNVQNPVHRMLGHIQNIHLLSPLSYPEFVYLMQHSTLILTDSGGIQEEAPTLNKPVLVMRDVTERTEAVDAGVVKLIGTAKKAIVDEVSALLTNEEAYKQMADGQNPYGDGTTAIQIIKVIQNDKP